MTVSSGVLPITTSSQLISGCGVGQEATVFGLVFVNSTTALRVVTLSIYRQATALTTTMPFEIAAKERFSWPKAIALQPGDHVDVLADAAGVNLLWSIDLDTGSAPVATGFTPRGAYNSGTAYSANDVVFYSGSSYAALRTSTNAQPDTHTADWMLLLDGSGLLAIGALIVGSAPSNLDTLGEIAAAIGNDPNFVTTMATALAAKAAVGRQITGGGLVTGGGDLGADRVLTVAAATVADLWAGSSTVKALTPFVERKANEFQPLTYATTIAWDVPTQGLNTYVILTGNGMIGAPTGLMDGDPVSIELIQDATGSRFPTWHSVWEWGTFAAPGSVGQPMQTAANKADFVFGIYRSRTGKIHANFRKGA